MNSLLSKTFGGLSLRYYGRHFLFGLIFPVMLYFASRDTMHPPGVSGYLLPAINCFLYPYARFVYEGVVSFIVGENVFFFNIWVMLLAKLITMAVCWGLAVFMAPVGLVYLYFYHSRSRARPDSEY